MALLKKKLKPLKEKIIGFGDLERDVRALEKKGIKKIEVAKADFTVGAPGTASLRSFLLEYFPKLPSYSVRGVLYDFQDHKRFAIELEYFNSKLVKSMPQIGFTGTNLDGCHSHDAVAHEDIARQATVNIYVG
jgi:hypothetical protein